MFICRNSEGVHAYLLKYCMGTCSSVGMLKGYMARERLGTPALYHSTQATMCLRKEKFPLFFSTAAS